MMDQKKIAKDIINHLGGKENITNCVHCITRLRFTLSDDSRVDREAIEKLDGVMGISEQGGQFQVIIGTSVSDVFHEIEPLLGKINEATEPETKKKFTFISILDAFTSIIAPVIPAFCAAGMLKAILLLLTSLGVCDGTEDTYVTFSMISDVAFYFLPILIAASSAKRFNVNQGLAICVAGALVYPDFVNMVNEGTPLTFLGLNVPMYSYSSTIFPSLLGVLLLSYVYKFWDKVVKWNTIKLLVVPLLSLAVTIPISLLAIAPLGNWGAEGLGWVFRWSLGTMGPFAGLIIGFLMPIMTLTGLHQSLTPVEIYEMTTYGFSVILPIEFFHNIAESGAALGTSLVTKDKKFKAIAYQTGTTAFIGISEPALYSVMVKDRLAMLSAMIGNGVGGFLGVLFALKMFAFVWPNIFSIPTFFGDSSISSNFILLLISIAATFTVSFTLPTVFKALGLRKENEIEIMSPVSGKVIPLSDVKDEVFSKGTCGDGIAIYPSEGKIVSPCDGEIVVAMNHAVGIRAKNGSEILIHAGIDTVKLNGDGLNVYVKKGEKVKSGQLLIEVDLPGIERKGYDATCIIVKTNGEVQDKINSDEVVSGKEIFVG